MALCHCQIAKQNDRRQNNFDPAFSKYDRLVTKTSTPKKCLRPEYRCIEDSLNVQMIILFARFIKKFVKIVSLDVEGAYEGSRRAAAEKRLVEESYLIVVSVTSHRWSSSRLPARLLSCSSSSVNFVSLSLLSVCLSLVLFFVSKVLSRRVL